MAKNKTKTIYRSSETGRIVKEEYAKKYPNITEKERIKIIKKK